MPNMATKAHPGLLSVENVLQGHKHVAEGAHLQGFQACRRARADPHLHWEGEIERFHGMLEERHF